MGFKLAKRAITIGWSAGNTFLGAVFSVLLSIAVIRLCSKELWGSMVQIMLWFGFASHIISFGNGNLLLREFSLMPKNISENWSKSIQARIWLYIAISMALLFLPVPFKIKILLLIYLAANFLYRSYDVVILFKKQFIVSVLLETAGFFIIASFILEENKSLILSSLVAIYTIAEVGKAITIFFLFRKEIKIPPLSINMAYFSLALPFFLLEFTGLLQSKTDLICVTSLLTKEKIAQYQVYVNFLLIIQSSAGFILAPFIKNIYRINSKSIQKLATRFLGLGVCIAFISIFFIHFFIHFFYGFSIPLETLVIGALFIIPIFYYAITIYQLFKLNRQNVVVLVNVIGVIIALVLNLIFIPLFHYEMKGAIIAIAITQWVLLFIYLIIQKSNSIMPILKTQAGRDV